MKQIAIDKSSMVTDKKRYIQNDVYTVNKALNQK